MITASGPVGSGAVDVVTQYVTAQVTGTDAQGRTTTGEQVEQVVVTVTNTAAAGSAGGNAEPQVVTVTATNANEQATGGVVVVTLTESSTSTEANGSQVVVVKVCIFGRGQGNAQEAYLSIFQTITSSVRYTRPAGTATVGGGSGSLQTQTGSSAKSLPLSVPMLTTIVGVISALFLFGASSIG